MYESLDQKNPVFDAKGIETVRRDGCPAVAKVTCVKYSVQPVNHNAVIMANSVWEIQRKMNWLLPKLQWMTWIELIILKPH